MEVLYRFFENGNEPFRRFLDRLNIPYKYEESLAGKTVFLLISENHKKWPALAKAYRNFGVEPSAELRFSKEELIQAEWLELGVTSHFGYPQPEDGFVYRSSTYQPGSVCECGIRGEQVMPFRFRKAPSQTRSHLLQLNWVFDEFFVSVEARRTMEDVGLSGFFFCAPVLHRSGEPIPGWFQLCVTTTLPAALLPQSLDTEQCSTCRKVKFNHPRGKMLRFDKAVFKKLPDIVRTEEWFGSGGSAYRVTLISQRFARLVLNKLWRGVWMQPISLHPRLTRA
jgi:hypothetical protein